MHELELSFLLDTEEGLDVKQDFSDTLSGGEQQRLGFARLLYHRPAYAILDESTSALDEQLEDKCMRMCVALGITCISVGHRPSLIRHHEVVLRLNGKGGYTIEETEQPENDSDAPLI